MSAAARGNLDADGTRLAALEEEEEASSRRADATFVAHEMDGGEPTERPRITCWTAVSGRVESIDLDQGLALFDACQKATGPDDHSAPLVWIDVACPREPEAEFLRDRLRFHPLAVEDCIRGRQRPKLDRYPGYFFFVIYAATINPQRERMALHEVHLFLGRRYIVTVHDHRVPEFGEVLDRWQADPASFDTVGVLGHAILDTIVDHYFPVIDHFSDRVEEMEARIFEGAREHVGLEHLLNVRREMTLFRKVLGPQRDVISTLLRRDLPFLSSELALYFQDVHDHMMRVVEEIDTLRDLLTGAMEAQLSVTSNQLNITMRVMAAWSIILMAMALIAGIYGMNFHIMPELAWRFGYEWALGLMVVLGAVLLLYFKKRHWL
ncbi:MAG TPA: magnesium/cobalt transporter CorA [Longimicrobiaceae bacterium]|nr:magnesium/cobalt transporter CorA [Longimicrobiaceae bacterium]